MNDLIAQTAGKIWKYLAKNESAEISKLPKALDEKQLIVFQALGWLARENKIVYAKQGRKDCVALSPSEQLIAQTL